MKKTITIHGVNIKYDNKNITIYDSYKIQNTEYMEVILSLFKLKTGYKTERSMKSWIKEWKAHNRLYKLGLFKKHTVDCDLEENEKLHRLIIYQILGI